MRNDTLMHSLQVGVLAKEIAVELGLDRTSALEVLIAGICHDVGKSLLPKSILEKPGKLTNGEFELVKKHTTLGSKLLSRYNDTTLNLAAEAALNHHERYDGTGYMGKTYDEVSLAARIVAAADVYSALIEERIYRPAWKRSDALFFIEKNAGKQFDPEVSAALHAVINKKEVMNGIKDDTGAGYCAGRYCRDSDHVH